jgi:hypothetical protein
MLGKFVHDAQAASAVHVIERLEQDCRSVVSMQTLRRVMFLITCICCCFYALFLFDTLGDARGAANSYWIFLVMALFPVALYVLSSVRHGLSGELGAAWRIDASIEDKNFEMKAVGPGPAQLGVEEGSSGKAVAVANQEKMEDLSAGNQARCCNQNAEIGATLSALHCTA